MSDPRPPAAEWGDDARDRIMDSVGITPGSVAADLWRRHSREIVENILHVTGYYALESIVRDLAELGDYECSSFISSDRCRGCDSGSVEHEAGCLVQRAAEWVANHPTDGDPAPPPQPTRPDPSVPERKDAE